MTDARSVARNRAPSISVSCLLMTTHQATDSTRQGLLLQTTTNELLLLERRFIPPHLTITSKDRGLHSNISIQYEVGRADVSVCCGTTKQIFVGAMLPVS